MNLEALRFLSYYRIRKSRALAVTPPSHPQYGCRHEEGHHLHLNHLHLARRPEDHRRQHGQ